MKKKLLTTLTAFACVLCCAFGLAACGGNNPGNKGGDQDVAIESISLDPATLTLEVDDCETLTVNYSPANATAKSVTWSSSAPDIVSVDGTGNVTALTDGTAVITATTANGKTADCNVTVNVKLQPTEGLEYEAYSGGYAYVTGYGTATDADVVIARTYKNKPVTGVFRNAFKNNTTITSVTIPEGVTTIYDEAFSGCTSLASVTLPDSITSLGASVFYNTAWYNNQPDGVVYLGKVVYAYKGTMPENTSITIREGTKVIGGYAFGFSCSGLTSITIPNSVKYINEIAFRGCSSLTEITIPNGVTEIARDTFENCTSLTSITIPDGVTTIGEYTFNGCSLLADVTIPDSVTHVGAGVFNNTAWYNNQPDGVVYVGKAAYKYKGTMPNNTSITLKNGTKSVTASAFSGCSGLVSINIPDGVTDIGASAFYNCSSLANVTIPDSVTNVVNRAFSGTAWISNQWESGGDRLIYAGKVVYEYYAWDPETTSITIEEGTKGIGDCAFEHCDNLISITIPASVTYVGEMAFYDCTSLADITFGGTVAQWNAITFGNWWDLDMGEYTVHCTDGDITQS